MKSLLLKNVLFVSLLSIAACGGESPKSPSPSETGSATVAAPIATTPAPVASAIVPDVVAPSAPREIAIPSTYAEALSLGKQLVESGDVQAKAVLEAAAKLDKRNAEPHIELARFFIGKNERANAVKAASKAVKLAPESSRAYNTLGRAELLRHNYDAAILAFRQSTELDNDNVWAWNNLGYTQLLVKKYDDAVDSLLTATSKKGATGYMWNNLGTAYEHQDQLDEAREAFESGGALGSSEAKASRKRLEGVDTIVVMHDEPKPDVVEKSYETREEMPAVVPVEEAQEPEEAPEPMAPVEDVEPDAAVAPTENVTEPVGDQSPI